MYYWHECHVFDLWRNTDFICIVIISRYFIFKSVGSSKEVKKEANWLSKAMNKLTL